MNKLFCYDAADHLSININQYTALTPNKHTNGYCMLFIFVDKDQVFSLEAAMFDIGISRLINGCYFVDIVCNWCNCDRRKRYLYTPYTQPKIIGTIY